MKDAPRETLYLGPELAQHATPTFLNALAEWAPWKTEKQGESGVHLTTFQFQILLVAAGESWWRRLLRRRR